MRLSQWLLSGLDSEAARTRRVLEKVPEDRMSWQPHENLHTLGWNANHLVEIVGWVGSIMNEDAFDVAPADGPAYETPSISDPAVLLEKFDENVEAARAAISSATDEALAAPWSLRAGGETLFTINKGECLRTWVLNHMVHHRGILSVGLRMGGVDVTPPYDG